MIRLETPVIRIGLQVSLPLQHKILLALVVVIAVVIIVIMYWMWRLRQFDKKRKTYQKVNFRELEICCSDIESKSSKIPLPHQPTRDQSDFYGSIDQRAIRFREALEKQLIIFEEKNEYRQRLEKTLSLKVDLSTDQLDLSEKFELMINDGKIYDDLNANMNRMHQALESAQSQLDALHNLEEEECQHVRDVGKEITTAQEHLQALRDHSVLGIQAEFVQSVHDQVETTEENLGQAELLIAAVPSWEQVNQAEDLCEKAVKAVQKFKRLSGELDQFGRTKAKVKEAREAVSKLEECAHKLEQESYGLLQAVQIEDEIDLDSQQQALEKAQSLLTQSRTDWSVAGDRAQAVLRHCRTKGISYLEKLQESICLFPYQCVAGKDRDEDKLAILLLKRKIEMTEGRQNEAYNAVLSFEQQLLDNKESQAITDSNDPTERNRIIYNMNKILREYSTEYTFNDFKKMVDESIIPSDIQKRESCASVIQDTLEKHYASNVVESEMESIFDEIRIAKKEYVDTTRDLYRQFQSNDGVLPPSLLIRALDSYRKKSIPCLERAGQLLDEVKQELKDFLNEREELKDRLLEVRSESFEVLTRDQKQQAQKILDSVNVLEEELQGCDDPKKLKEIENCAELIEFSVCEMTEEVESKRRELQGEIGRCQDELKKRTQKNQNLLRSILSDTLFECIEKGLAKHLEPVSSGLSWGTLTRRDKELRDFSSKVDVLCELAENFRLQKQEFEQVYQRLKNISSGRSDLRVDLGSRLHPAENHMEDLREKEGEIKEALTYDSFEWYVNKYNKEAQKAKKEVDNLVKQIREDIRKLGRDLQTIVDAQQRLPASSDAYKEIKYLLSFRDVNYESVRRNIDKALEIVEKLEDR